MNLSDLSRRVRRHLAEAGTGQHSDADIQQQISNSARSLAGELGLIQQEVTATTDDTGRLVIPGLVNAIGFVRYQSHTQNFDIINYNDVYNLDPRGWQATGNPKALVVDEPVLGRGVVALWPNNGAGITITLMAFVDGGDLTTPDAIPWGGRFDVYHDLIAYHAAHALMGQSGSAAAQNPVWMQRYQLRLEELRDRGSAGSLVQQTRMGSALRRRDLW